MAGPTFNFTPSLLQLLVSVIFSLPLTARVISCGLEIAFFFSFLNEIVILHFLPVKTSNFVDVNNNLFFFTVEIVVLLSQLFVKVIES